MKFNNVDAALPRLVHQLRLDGSEVGSRLGERTRELLHQQIVLSRPWQREVLTPHRNANIAAQIAETMWVLAGRNDVEWLARYLPRAVNFSDDGAVWRGGYGPRLRSWGSQARDGSTYRDEDLPAAPIDQLRHIADLLNAERGSRRGVVSIYDPAIDSRDGKDIPCNDFLSFISRNGHLEMSVFVRSNDLIWGWSGINAFEWSALQEILAGILGLNVGKLIFNTTSLHVYDRHWDKARRIEDSARYLAAGLDDSPPFSMAAMMNATLEPMHPVDALDSVIKDWFITEERIREQAKLPAYDRNLNPLIDGFPEPMMRSWLRIIAWYWTGDEGYIEPLGGTRLRAAVDEIPQSILTQVEERARSVTITIKADTSKFTEAMRASEMLFLAVGKPSGSNGEYQPGDTVDVYGPLTPEPLAHKPAFVEYVDNLHREKSAAYGDSWKKRGEQMSILANIARKNDRLESGLETTDETSADTAIDYLVYLIKYRLWLQENYPTLPNCTDNPDAIEETDALLDVLNRLSRTTVLDPTDENQAIIGRLLGGFEDLQRIVTNDPKAAFPESRGVLVDLMIPDAFILARRLWEQENVVPEREYGNPYRFAPSDEGPLGD